MTSKKKGGGNVVRMRAIPLHLRVVYIVESLARDSEWYFGLAREIRAAARRVATARAPEGETKKEQQRLATYSKPNVTRHVVGTEK